MLTDNYFPSNILFVAVILYMCTNEYAIFDSDGGLFIYCSFKVKLHLITLRIVSGFITIIAFLGKSSGILLTGTFLFRALRTYLTQRDHLPRCSVQAPGYALKFTMDS